MPRKREATQTVQTINAWSYSRFSTYDQCPRKAKYQIIDKAPFKTNDAMLRGKIIHTLAELFVKDSLKNSSTVLANKRDFPSIPPDFQKYADGEFDFKAVPVELELFDEEFIQLRGMFKNRKGIFVNPELQWAFTRNWTPCEWFAPQAWCRIMVDNFVINEKEGKATIIDYKTGKNRGGYEQQLKLYAAGAFALYPQLQEVRPELWFLDEGEIVEREEGPYTNDDADDLIKEWTKLVKPMLVDKRFAPKPSNLCRWCDFSKTNGGQCEY